MSTIVHLHASGGAPELGCIVVCGLPCGTRETTAYANLDPERVTCPECLERSGAGTVRETGTVSRAVTTWSDGYGRWYAAVPGDVRNPRRTAGRAIRREINAREALPYGYRVRIERAPVEWHTTSDPAARPVYREVMI